LIGARLERHIHDRSTCLTVLRVEIRGLDVDLLDGVYGRLCFIENAGRRIGAGSAINADFLREALQSVLARHRPALIAADRSTWHEPEEAHGIPHGAAEVYRQCAELLGRDRSGQLGGFGYEDTGVCRDFDGFWDLANLQ